MALVVRPYDAAADEAWATTFLDAEIGGRRQARRGELHDVLAPRLGLVADLDGARAGLLTYRLGPDDDEVELSVLAADPPARGVGSALVAAFLEAMRLASPIRIWVVTTNDNLDALRFYQRRGFRLRALRAGAIDEARRTLKPEIGEIGEHDIPLRDELELVLDVR
jgi:ribosomal protein S18 acetylase RimI-like enzyme